MYVQRNRHERWGKSVVIELQINYIHFLVHVSPLYDLILDESVSEPLGSTPSGAKYNLNSRNIHVSYNIFLVDFCNIQ